jgi:two-component system response regulator ArlR
MHIREVSYLPIIVLGNQEEAAESLELGADVFMTKPPSLRELVARVRSLLQRKSRFEGKKKPPGTSITNNSLNESAPVQDKSDGLKYFTSTEFRLAKYLINNEGNFIDYSRIIRDVWDGNKVSIDTIHFYVRRLRKKLQALFPYQVDIINYRGIGYRLEEQI